MNKLILSMSNIQVSQQVPVNDDTLLDKLNKNHTCSMFMKDNIRLTYYFHHSIKMLFFIHKQPLFFIGSADGKERSSLSSADTPTDATQIPAHLILPPSKRPLSGAGHPIRISPIWAWASVLSRQCLSDSQ